MLSFVDFRSDPFHFRLDGFEEGITPEGTECFLAKEIEEEDPAFVRGGQKHDFRDVHGRFLVLVFAKKKVGEFFRDYERELTRVIQGGMPHGRFVFGDPFEVFPQRGSPFHEIGSGHREAHLGRERDARA